MKIYAFIGILLFAIVGCSIGRVELSKDNLNKKVEKGKIQKITFDRLPLEVSDTLSKMFDWYVETNKSPCELGKSILFERYIVLDSNFQLISKKNKKGLHEGTWFIKRYGTRLKFNSNSNRFILPIDARITNLTIFNGKMYVMGVKPTGIKRIFNCKDPNYLKIHYEKYLYWVLDLK